MKIMKKLLLFILLPVLSIAQVQIGSNVNGEAAEDNSGWSVSISKDGTTLAVGAIRNDGNVVSPTNTTGNMGHVRVYRKDAAGAWMQIGPDINGENPTDQSGFCVSLSTDGNTVAIGANQNDAAIGPFTNTVAGNAGHVRVYKYNGTSWDKLGADIDGEVALDTSGRSVSLSGDGTIVAIGAHQNDAGLVHGPIIAPATVPNNNDQLSRGHVRVYKWDGTSWTQLGGAGTGDIDGELAQDLSGFSVSLSTNGDVVAIGAYLNDGSGVNAGHVRVYNFNGTAWVQLGNDIDGEVANDQSGRSVSISGDGTTVAIGALNSNGGGVGAAAGSVRVYKINGTLWDKVGGDIDGEAAGDANGSSVALSNDGTTLAIGAQNNDAGVIPGPITAPATVPDNNDLLNRGRVRIFKNVLGVWTKLGNNIDGQMGQDQNGYSISLSADGKSLAIGAIGGDASGLNSGTVRVFDLTNAVLSSDSFVLANFSAYPNPASDVVTISLQEGLQLEKVNIYNTLGQLVKTETTNVITVNTLVKGSYFFEVISDKGKATKKILVK